MSVTTKISPTAPCVPWPTGFKPLTAQQSEDMLIIACATATSARTCERNMLAIAGIRQGNLTCALNPQGRLACIPTFRGKRALN